MPFYKCYGCMKTFMSEGRATSCRYCQKLLNEEVNRQPGPPRLERRHSAPVLGALTQAQQVVAMEKSKQTTVFKPRCPLIICRSEAVTRQGPDGIFNTRASMYECDECNAYFLWTAELGFEPSFAYTDVTYRQGPLNMVAFRGLNLPSPLDCLKIFKRGFPVRTNDDDGGKPWTIQYRTNSYIGMTLDQEVFPKVGDIFPESAHCFSARVAGATIFPNDTAVTRTYVFVCFLREGFNTYEQQRAEVELLRKYYPPIFDSHEDQVAWPLAAREVACEQVAPEEVLASIRCDKVWNTGRWEDGGTYRFYLPSLMFNPTLGPQAKVLITRFLKDNRAGVIPATPT
ncbi:hypothetical protein [Corallococcus exercitus]|uniref:hypothetical protein n=1 Tax=Corallococcus exercitus TaxID=2316736 RepID=UPI0035D51B5B